ncbi:MAG TPA: hypothetical protein VGI45_04985 [Terracidiphilus sp.]
MNRKGTLDPVGFQQADSQRGFAVMDARCPVAVAQRCLTSKQLDSGGGAEALASNSAISSSTVIHQPFEPSFVPIARLKV